MARLKELYVKEVAPALMNKFSYKSTMQIPKLDKIVINVGAGEARENSKAIDAIVKDIAAITGQKPMVCHARKSVANFKLRQGMKIGVKVTLRGERMYEFIKDVTDFDCELYANYHDHAETADHGVRFEKVGEMKFLCAY